MPPGAQPLRGLRSPQQRGEAVEEGEAVKQLFARQRVRDRGGGASQPAASGASRSHGAVRFTERQLDHRWLGASGLAAVPRGAGVESGLVSRSSGPRGAPELASSERADGAATVRWARAQPWCDGWLASGGISYDGMAAVMLWFRARVRVS